MKYLLAFLFLFSFPAFAQQPPPEARPFAKGITTFEQYEAQKAGKDKKKGPDAKTPDGRQPYVEIWLPPEFQSSEQKWPLIVFSHGFGGCANESRFLTRYLADHGYIVIAPHHTDENCSKSRFGDSGGFSSRMTTMRAGQKREWPERSFRNPDLWTDKTEIDRKDDVVFALDSMFDDRQYRNYIDLARIGVIGNGLGGYTVLGLGGGWPAWKDKRFQAAFVLSPYVEPLLLQQRIKNVGVPVMYVGGTREGEATPIISKRGGAYDQTRAPKYYLELRDAEATAWTDADREFQVIIQNTALAFFDRYLKKLPVKMVYQPGKGQVADFREDQGAKK